MIDGDGELTLILYGVNAMETMKQGYVTSILIWLQDNRELISFEDLQAWIDALEDGEVLGKIMEYCQVINVIEEQEIGNRVLKSEIKEYETFVKAVEQVHNGLKVLVKR